VLRATDPAVQVATVRASDGKRARAEPVAQLVRGGLVQFGSDAAPQLESQWLSWDPDETRESPDRLDAHVWAVTHLGLRAPSATATRKPTHKPGTRPRRLT